MKEMIREIKEKLENSSFAFSIIGVVLFGSRARGSEESHSDIDILIVAKNINPKLHRRINEILQIKKLFKGIPLDILLFTPEEVISNFRNHNPLFLNIAEEGIIIIDDKNFISNLIKETKEYIRDRGIKKVEGGWQFPIEMHMPTYLSNITNKDFALAMLKDGERDLLIAQRLFIDKFYDKSVYHCQQSIEKCVKAILIALGNFQRVHFVGGILRKKLEELEIALEWKNKLLEIVEISEGIEPEISLTRYPTIIGDSLWLPYEEYEQEDAEISISKAKRAVEVTKDFLEYWFH